ncbi:MAG: sodium:solute symporter [Cyanobacteria bacterium SZAS LIN-2]|nr:sodium:solute symporter [Cyanobacteria bacterium SZAS LIN-2]MBS2007238.1 sodium:solute symporter [Cyanobacteria bacterium SZAS TMP-1]
MNWLDFVVLFGSIVSIAAYSIWRTRHRDSLHSYVKGSGQTPWFAIGLSVMATQASAITFLSTPGQGYLNGLSFIQIYFGVPIALLVISIFFLPIFSHLHVYTAYEFLEKRFDAKTRLLGAALFLLQRGLGAGLTIYAPAIVLTTVFGWPLDLTIISSGLLVILYTVMGGSDAVTMTQKYQLGIIFAGMVTAACVLMSKLPSGLDLSDTLALAGGFHRLNAVNFSTDIHERYTIWSGLLGGTFLMLSYFGTDQSQVQRYISGSSLRESRLGLLFNAICKIPMQFCILSIGVLIFVFYQFQPPPLFFDSTANKYLAQHQDEPKLITYKNEFARGHKLSKGHLVDWLKARHQGDAAGARTAFAQAQAAQKTSDEIRQAAQAELKIKTPLAKANDADYVFITFILQQLPHGAIGLLIAAFFAAALSSKAAELNALGVSTSIDFYRLLQPHANDFDCLRVTKWATAAWGLIAIGFALFAHLSENLIQAVNILGSIFYGVMLGIFLAAFFIKRIGGTAIFWAALTAQMLVFVLYFTQTISYLWYPLIGCAACIIIGLILQGTIRNKSATKGNTQ